VAGAQVSVSMHPPESVAFTGELGDDARRQL
jgi:hypothetical protein